MKNHDDIRRYVHDIAGRLGLSRWHLDLSTKPTDDGAVAAVEITCGRRHAVIYVCEGFLRRSPQDQRDDITHELVHCMLRDIQDTALSLEKQLEPGTWAQFYDRHHNAMELLTDALAGLLSQQMPLPPRAGKSRPARRRPRAGATRPPAAAPASSSESQSQPA